MKRKITEKNNKVKEMKRKETARKGESEGVERTGERGERGESEGVKENRSRGEGRRTKKKSVNWKESREKGKGKEGLRQGNM